MVWSFPALARTRWFRGQPVRVAVLLQPVASERGRGMAVIQVAETLELRRTLAPGAPPDAVAALRDAKII